mgnify:CR=1 FL=1|jgi:hypothetical protein
MSRKICEKSIFDVLLYRKHKLYQQYSSKYSDTTFGWIHNQSKKIEKKGFDHWYNNTDGPLGPPSDLPIRKNPIFYKLYNV